MDRSPTADPDGPLVVADEAAEPPRAEEPAEPAYADKSAEPAYAEEPAEPVVVSVGDEEPVHRDWWHRDHPTFTAISGFFSGLVFATVVPGLFMATIRFFADDSSAERTAEEAFPFVLLFLVIPIAAVAFPQTRRFGTYLMFGIVVALAVILGVGTFVFWLMIRYSS